MTHESKADPSLLLPLQSLLRIPFLALHLIIPPDRPIATNAPFADGGVNQDSFVLQRGEIEGLGVVVVAAVFDGHSPGGEHAARTAALFLRNSFEGALIDGDCGLADTLP